MTNRARRFLQDVEARLLAEREATLSALRELDERKTAAVTPESPPRPRRRIATGEREAILRAPEQLRTTMDELARRLNVSRRTVIRVLKAAGKSPGQGRRLGVESW